MNPGVQAPVRLERFTGRLADREIRTDLDETLAQRLAAVSGDDPEALLVLGMAALAVLAERYTCERRPLLATTAPDSGSAEFFVHRLEPHTTGRALIDQLNEEYTSGHEPSEPLGRPETITGWGLTVQGITPAADWLAMLEFRLEWAGSGHLVTHYCSKAYPELRAARMTRQYLAALRGILNSPDRLVSEIEALEEADAHRLLHHYNRTQTAFPQTGIAQLFEECVRAHPETIALVDVEHGSEEWTYRELDQHSNLLAGHLVRLGLRREERVPVMADRSALLVASMLAVLKAGGAYVPVDPASPAERVAAMLRDCEARFFIGTAAYSWACAGLLRIDPALVEAQDDFVSLTADPEALAYVMYTSGSTGTPKGVMVPHRAVVRLVRNTNYIEFSQADRVLQTASMAFDAATLEVWGPLLNGGMLVLAPTDELLDPARLKALLEQHKITVLWLTATWFHQLVDTDITLFGKLRHLLAGGEKLSTTHVNRVRAAWPELKITNGYGPTENTTFATCHSITEQYDGDIPIGEPIANTSVIVLDARGRLAPEGALGELCAGGAGLARGYQNAPEQTALKFIAHPFSSGERLYRTGDRARWREGGTLDFLGRLDDQIKLRGHRIEPGEIEAVLVRHPQVRHAVAAVRQEQLIAWIVADEGCPSGQLTQEVLRFAEALLPQWMVPARCIVLVRLPLNQNGKVDRNALLVEDTPADQGPPPRTEMERRIAAVWEAVLGQKAIGVHADFFELGGHSLRAGSLIAKINRQANVAISFQDLFRYPTIAQMAKWAETSSGQAVAAIPRIADASAYSTSSAQRRLWILDQLDPGRRAYNMPACFLLNGPLQERALSSAIRALVERHEILRTRFVSHQGEPMQIVEHSVYEAEYHDATGKPDAMEWLKAEMAHEALRCFDLDRLPLFRVSLCRLAEDRHALAVHLHHIVGDAWSCEVLLRELTELYESSVKGTESPLPPPRIQYRDAAAWQNAQLKSRALDNDLAYWQKQLRGLLPVLDLPQDYTRPPVQTTDGQTLSFPFGPERSSAFAQLSKRLGAHYSEFTVLLAVLYTLLHRLSNQSDLILGIPVAGRQHPDLEDQVGFYVNTLPLRQRVTGNDTFHALLERVQEKLAEALDHQAYPFEELVEKLEIQRDISRGSVFDVFAAFQDQEHFALQLAGLQTEPFPIEATLSKFDLSFYFSHGRDGLRCSIEYNTALFAAETIGRFGSHLFALVDDLASRTDVGTVCLGDLQVLNPEMRRRILAEFNATARRYPANDTIVSLFEAQAGRTPDAIAVSFEQGSITYGELNGRSNFLAECLVAQHGVKPGDLVGVLRERNVETIAALLAVMKAGAAYVPADRAYPPARVQYLLADSRVKLVVTDAASLPTAAGLGFAALDLETLPGLQRRDPGLAARPEDLAYIIYTSGSAGQPKGVAIEHRQAANFLHWCAEEFARDFEVVFAGTSLCFDLSFFEIFYPLTIGKRVRLLRSGLEIGEWLPRERGIVVNAVPSTVRDLVAAGGDLSYVRMMNMAGEPIPLALIERLQQSWPGLPIRNLYGPSEDTTYTTSYQFPDSARRVLVGKPVANTDVYILDARMQPVPIGVPGELYLAGAKLARGYLHRPDLTSEKFLPNPFYPERPWARMYRTQDLARWTADGNLDYLGRNDDQVKIRGYRIELGEVEHALRRHPAVRDAAVVAQQENLIAFIAAEQAPATDDITQFLQTTLPAFMIPARFVHLDALPLTPNGKVDRKALHFLGSTSPAVERAFVGPRDPVERTLAGLWETVLEKGPVSVTDGFFELGGHSLRATRLLGKAAAALGEAMPLKDFFATPTIAAQANWYRTHPGLGRPTVPLPIPAALPDAAGTFALSPGQMRLWILDQLNPRSTAYHMPAVFQIRSAVDVARLVAAFREVVDRHESTRTRLVRVQGEPRQVIDAKGPELEVVPVYADCLDTAVASVLERPFDLAAELPVRAALFQTGPDRYTMAFVMHHVAGDGWSLNLLVGEMMAAYSGEPGKAPLAIQYRDYAAWANARLTSGELDGDKAWWQETLKVPLPTLDLPTDFRRPTMQSHAGAEIAFELDRFTGSDATLFSLLLAGLQTLLFRYTGQEDIIIGTPVAGRTHPLLESQVGLYVNTLALRGAPSGNQTFAELLAAAQQATVAAMDHQEYPFDRLVEDLGLPRDVSRSAVFDVMLVVEQGKSELALPGLTIREVPAPVTSNKFDLTLYATETERGIACRLVYSTALFRHERMQRMARHFRNLLTAAVRDPGQHLNQLDILDPAETHLLVHGWNHTARPYPLETAIDRFERIAGEMSQSPAVGYGGVKLTYGELNRRANALAMWLRDVHHVGPGDAIAVMMHADEWLPAALLAIWKVGCAYVPVDPGNPEARMKVVLNDCNVRTVLTSEDVAGLKLEPSEIGPHRSAQPEDVAYIIYTSGTTGTPKGARQPHRALVNYVCWLGREFGIGPGARSGLTSSYAFDLGYTSLWGTLLNGGELVLPHGRIAAEPEELIRWMVASELTYLKLTPSLFQWLMGSPSCGSFSQSHVKLILLGGETPRAADVRRFLQIKPGTRIVNHYGPTETTIGCIAGDWLDSDEQPTLGRPIDNTRAYIVDRAGNTVPIGIPGEIWVAGAGVGLGYLNVPGPFSEDPWYPGESLYRTGDLGSWTEDGRVQFLGRSDRQVKVRGYRVELREIEQALREMAGVNAAVLVADQSDGRTELVAGIAGSDSLTASDVRAFVAVRLPEYMVPSRFAILPRLPLTANGKVDDDALRAASVPALPMEQPVQPRNELERRLAENWCEVLRQDQAGVREDFFLAGGNSLRAASLLSRVYRDTGVSIGLGEFFSTPTIEWLGQRIGGTRVEVSAGITLERVPEAHSYELAHAQERLWLLQHIDRGGLAYSMPSGFLLEGKVDSDRLRRAFEVVAARQEALRTVFFAEDGRPRQRVLPAWTGTLQESEACDLAAASELQRADAAKPFDLEHGPLVRLHLIRIGDGQCVLLLNMHHIVSDGWSMTVLAAEVMASYRDPIEAALAPLQYRYRDIAAWQRKLADTAEEDRAYWLDQFAQPLEPLDLPADRLRPGTQSFEGDRATVIYPAEWKHRVEELALTERATLFMVLAAGVHALLARYSGQCDICIGTAVAGRNTPEIEKLIGLFVQTLPLRCHISMQARFRELLRQMREVVLGAFDHASYSFDRLVEELALARDLSRNPMFDVMVVLQNTEPLPTDFAGIRATPLPPLRGAAKFDLNFIFTAEENGMRLDLEYATALFDRDRIERLCDHLRALLEDAVEHPSRALGDLHLLTATEESAFWTVARGPECASEPESILQRFREQVANDPDAPSLDLPSGSVTYAELDSMSSRVASALRMRWRIAPKDIVGLEMPGSECFVVAMLGVWKAGAAWMPIDPSHPEARRVLIASRAATILREADVRLIAEDASADVDLLPDVVSYPENLAYVLFTSGSSGEPKGCMVEHRNIFNYIDWASREYPQRPSFYSLHSSINFDLTLTSLLCPLVRGECLRVYPPGQTADQMLVDSFSATQPVNFVKLTPSHIDLLAELPVMNSNVAVAVVGGEAMTPPHVATLRRLNPAMRILNEYGPTEAAVGSTCFHVGSEQEGEVPIGFPIQNSAILILDENLEPMPERVPGEICITGAGVSRGYLGRGDLTAEKFVPHPYGNGERLYRTGDRGYWTPSGIHYLGRRDGQVKIRGHRVELAEIEAALKRCDGVRQVVADIRDGVPIAWVVGDGDPATWSTTLREMLPHYMLPARILPVAEIPLTQHGKVDRSRLQLPRAEVNTSPEPETSRELVLAGVWRTVLNREHIGRGDNFFFLGGDSIRAVQMTYRLREQGWRLDVPALFASPKLANAAMKMERLEQRQARSAERELLPLTPIQDWFFRSNDSQESRNLFHQSLMFSVPVDLDHRALEQALNAVVRQHEALRLRFANGHQRVAPVAECLTVVLRSVSVEDIAEVHSAIDIERGPMLQAALVRGLEGTRLLVVIHHLAVDTYSWRVILEDLERAYFGLELSTPTDSFGAWAEALDGLRQSGLPASEVAWWDEIESGDYDALAFDAAPLSSDRSARLARRVEAHLSAEETACLIGPVNAAYDTNVQDLLLTGLAESLHAWCGVRRLKVFVESHGREALDDFDVSRTVGWFTTRYPVAIEAGDVDSEHLVRRVKETLRGTPRFGAGYGLSHRTYQAGGISFNYLGQFESQAEGAFRILREDAGPNSGPESVLQYDLSIVSVVEGGQLLVEFTAPGRVWSEKRIEDLMSRFLAFLRRLIARCETGALEHVTPAQFTFQGLSADEFERIFDGE